jgi:hypothetical protein
MTDTTQVQPRRCAFVLLIGVCGLASVATAAPDDVAAELAAEGVWAYLDATGEVRPSGSFTGIPPDSALTAAGLEKRTSFDFTTDDPVLGCGPPGMPRALTAASPMTFSWNQDLLIIRYESMDVTRIIFMEKDAVPPRTPSSPDGYAIGRWEGDTLVIETSHLDGRIQDLQGTPKSDAMTLVERYELEGENAEQVLRVDLIMQDPTYFSEPYVWHFDFVHKPDWALLEYACEERPAELTPGILPTN